MSTSQTTPPGEGRVIWWVSGMVTLGRSLERVSAQLALSAHIQKIGDSSWRVVVGLKKIKSVRCLVQYWQKTGRYINVPYFVFFFSSMYILIVKKGKSSETNNINIRVVWFSGFLFLYFWYSLKSILNIY